MKNKVLNVLRSSCNGLKPRYPNAVADVASAQYSSSAAQRLLVSDVDVKSLCFWVLSSCFCSMLVRDLRLELIMFMRSANYAIEVVNYLKTIISVCLEFVILALHLN